MGEFQGSPMIVSASYRTDIPTFYGAWFMNRLRAGYCMVPNPYGGRPYRVSLRPADVDGIVFWTKNLAPFLPHLAEVRERGVQFVVQYAINGYPRALESAVVDVARSVAHVRRVAGEFGPKVCVWRYDTIVSSSLTPRDHHVRTFERLAGDLAGAVDEVVISFAQVYRKTKRNLDAAAAAHGFTWDDPADEEKRSLASELAGLAQAHGIRLTVCSQHAYLVPGAGDARCIDAERLAAVAGRSLPPARLKGNRPECGCYESRDIGAYDTCPHGCAYCYAVRGHDLARARFARHDPDGEYLFAPAGG